MAAPRPERTENAEVAEKPNPPPELIGNIAELSQNAKGIYFLYIGVLAYCALTVAGTSDRQIVLNESTTLPVINVQVSLEGFFILAPLLAIFLFIYFQIYLGRLRQLFFDLRTKFRPINEAWHIYPWMLNFADEAGAGFTTRFMSTFSIWWSLPIVLMLLALWYLKKHEPVLGSIIGLLPIIGTLIVLAFWIKKPGQPRKIGTSQLMLLGIAILFEFIFFGKFMPDAMAGKKIIGAWPTLDVSYENLVQKQDVAYTTLYWGELSKAKLQGANFTGAILQKVDLSGTDLRKAIFTRAVLKDANLEGANLQEARLEFAELDGINLHGANLVGADFTGVNLQGFDFTGYNLRNTVFIDANLQSSIFVDSELNGTIFRGARLDSASFYLDYQQFDSTTDFRGATLKGVKDDFTGPDAPWEQENLSRSGLSEQRFELHQQRQVVLDLKTGLTWQRSGSDRQMGFYDAQVYIEQLNRENVAGFNYWRLPTVEEAKSLSPADSLFDSRQNNIWTRDFGEDRGWCVSLYTGEIDEYRSYDDEPLMWPWIRAVVDTRHESSEDAVQDYK